MSKLGITVCLVLTLAFEAAAIRHAKRPGYSTILGTDRPTLFDLMNSDENRHQFAQSFFPLVQEADPLKVGHPLHMQADVPKGKSLLAQKHPDLYPKIQAMRLDFETLLTANPTINPLHHILVQEEEIRSSSNELPKLMVNPDAMRHILDKVMSTPRNSLSHAKNKDNVGSLIFGKFGTLGLVTHMQSFDTKSLQTVFNDPVSARTC
jgi:hypothetical protein